MLWIAGKCVLWKQISPNLSGKLRTWKDAWKLHSNRLLHACSLSHMAYWALMFTAKGCSTYYVVYLTKRAFLSSGKELGLKWHVFGLVSYVTYSDVRVAVWFFSLSCGPPDGYRRHLHVLNGLMFECTETWADHAQVAHLLKATVASITETLLVTRIRPMCRDTSRLWFSM